MYGLSILSPRTLGERPLTCGGRPGTAWLDAMKLFRFGEGGAERVGVVTEAGRRVDLSSLVPRLDAEFWSGGGLAKLRTEVRDREEALPEVGGDVRLGPPVEPPTKIVCVGMNYAKHAEEIE